jgi:hypothetical protein
VATPPRELADAVGALLEGDPARIASLASGLRGPNRVLESTVVGMSMGRGLGPGSRIRIELSDRARYDVGEVVAFLSGPQVIVHRVVHRGRAGAAAGHVLTRGDAVLVPDPPLPHDRILGPVVAVRSEEGWTQPAGARRRSIAAGTLSRLALWAAMGALYLSPRAAGMVSSLLHRAERILRSVVARAERRKPPGPGQG